ncbi:MAG: VanZ family protein [Paludibacteraceae bacterium]|nr:VanZ family protein [Paludibacteraceae bacterium]
MVPNSNIIHHTSKIFSYLPAVALTVGIAVLSLWEYPHIPKEIHASDKVLHALMYLFFAMAWIAPSAYQRLAKLATYAIVLLATTAYGALMEILQRFCTLSRSGEMADLYADFLGALIGLILVALCQRLFTTSH